jgi:hypothetical protein
MALLSPRGHTADSRELLTAVTARVPLQLVHDSTAHPTEPADGCVWCNPNVGCFWPRCQEMSATAGGSPTVPTRRIRRPTPLPALPWWRRLVLRLFPTFTRT